MLTTGIPATGEEGASCRAAMSACCNKSRDRGACPDGADLFARCLDYLETALLRTPLSSDATEVDGTLEDLSCMLDHGPELSADNFSACFVRLNRIYAHGIGQLRNPALTRTAALYADLVRAAGRRYPEADYSEALGQLLCYMGQHYQHRRESWKRIYEHALDLLRSVKHVGHIDAAFLDEIEQWTEEGVGNLFNIREDTEIKIVNLEKSVSGLMELISDISATLPQDMSSRRVVQLKDLARRKELEQLHDTCLHTMEDIRETRAILKLVDENIEEFERKLQELRRSYNVRSVD